MSSVGYLCGDKLIADVDNELLLLTYDNIANKFVDVSRFRGGINDGCKEVEVNVEEQYSVKYFPRIYYTIFRLQFGNSSGYLLESFDGSSGLAWFFTCNNYKECKELIKVLEE